MHSNEEFLSHVQWDIRSWSLYRETEVPSGWTWSEPAAGPAPPAGAALSTAPDRCHCCLWQKERKGWTDRNKEERKVTQSQGKMRRKRGRMGHLSVWMQVNIQGGVDRTLIREAFNRVGQSKKDAWEIKQKWIIGEKGSKIQPEVLSLWQKCLQTNVKNLNLRNSINSVLHSFISYQFTHKEKALRGKANIHKKVGRFSLCPWLFFINSVLTIFRQREQRRKKEVETKMERKSANGEEWERKIVRERKKEN